MNIIIAGGTGLIGSRLAELLVEKGYGVHILSRQDKEVNTKNIRFYKWIIGESIDMDVFENVGAIINLTGAGIADRRWTSERKKELTNSRIDPAKFLLDIMKAEGIYIPLYCSASGSNIYPSSDTVVYEENDAPGRGFINQLCEKWERQAMELQSHSNRVVILRTGVVLARSNSFLQKFTLTTKFFIAGLFGSGHQRISWIHIDDLCGQYIHAIENESVKGIFNAGISKNETHLRFIKTFLKRKKRKVLIVKAPKFVSKLVFGEMSCLLNKGVAISHEKIKQQGYTFKFESLDDAIGDLLD